jgi:cephalosporin hydroxylase
MNPIDEFNQRNNEITKQMSADKSLKAQTKEWIINTSKYEYTYHFTWLGRPIIQFPQDMVAAQEIIWKIQPDLIIETGIAHGGSLIFYASILEMIGKNGKVLGIDTDIREHNRQEIEKHPLSKRITMLQGSSTATQIVDKVYSFARDKKNIMLLLDSNHTHEHVLKELLIYSPLVKKDGYLIVFDTIIEDMPEDFYPDRPWGKGNNPKTAVAEFLQTNDRFIVDKDIEDKLLITMSESGYLRCVR